MITLLNFLLLVSKALEKQIHNSLSDGLFLQLDYSKKIIEKAEIETTRRPSTLTMFEWENYMKAGKILIHRKIHLVQLGENNCILILMLR